MSDTTSRLPCAFLGIVVLTVGRRNKPFGAEKSRPWPVSPRQATNRLPISRHECVEEDKFANAISEVAE